MELHEMTPLQQAAVAQAARQGGSERYKQYVAAVASTDPQTWQTALIVMAQYNGIAPNTKEDVMLDVHFYEHGLVQ